MILDELILPVGCVDNWLADWRSNYLPGALGRGLELRGLWTGWTEDPDLVMVVVEWSIRNVGRYWAARFAATDDPLVSDFWVRTDDLVTNRDRRVLERQSGA